MNVFKFTPLIIFIFLNTLEFAQAVTSTDKQEPVDITANRLLINQNDGTLTYFSNVHAQQGTRTLKGNKMVVHQQQSNQLKWQVQSVTMTGNPAHLTYLRVPQNSLVKSHAQQIAYYPQEHRFVLSDKAYINNRGNVFKGPLIEYNTITQEITAKTVDNDQPSIELIPSALKSQPSHVQP